MKYRPEIDGLRAIAVLSVMFFHAKVSFFAGGYIGVDVFFVISGFLITSIIVTEVNSGVFSIARFYERRARRILPALTVVMLLSIPPSFLLLTPNQLVAFSKSLVATSLFSSNILFWRESDYFAPAAESKPLLHTWSLAVEEQYYIFFPLFVMLLWPRNRRLTIIATFLLLFSSLVLSEWGSRVRPVANFYLAPTRFWELLVGSLCAFYLIYFPAKPRNLPSLMGLIALLVFIFFADEDVAVPSLIALVPVFATALIVVYAQADTIAAVLLRNRLLVSIGLVSYSAYLFHQPLFVFGRFVSMNDSNPLTMFGLMAVTLLAAWASWRWVELPFRTGRFSKIPRGTVFSLALLSVLTFSFLGFSGVYFRGFDNRLTDDQRYVLSWESNPRLKADTLPDCFLRFGDTVLDLDREGCLRSESNFLVWGDSHAHALAQGWRKSRELDELTMSGCRPLLELVEKSMPACQDFNNFVLTVVREMHYSTVVIHAYWTKDPQKTYQLLGPTLVSLSEAGVENIVILGGVPQFYPSLPQQLLAFGGDLSGDFNLPDRQHAVRKVDYVLRKIALDHGAVWIDLVDLFCDGDLCDVTVPDGERFAPTAWDYGHLTQKGAEHLGLLLDMQMSAYLSDQG